MVTSSGTTMVLKGRGLPAADVGYVAAALVVSGRSLPVCSNRHLPAPVQLLSRESSSPPPHHPSPRLAPFLHHVSYLWNRRRDSRARRGCAVYVTNRLRHTQSLMTDRHALPERG